MAKKKLGRWFADYIDRSTKSCRIGSIVLVPLSLIVAWLTYWIIWVTLWIGFRPLFDSIERCRWLSLLPLPCRHVHVAIPARL